MDGCEKACSLSPSPRRPGHATAVDTVSHAAVKAGAAMWRRLYKVGDIIPYSADIIKEPGAFGRAVGGEESLLAPEANDPAGIFRGPQISR